MDFLEFPSYNFEEDFLLCGLKGLNPQEDDAKIFEFSKSADDGSPQAN